MNNKKGFTLIEIIVVLVIVGVLAAISITSLYSWIERSKFLPVALLNLKQIKDNIEVCKAKKGEMVKCVQDADDIVAQMQPNLPLGYELDAVYADSQSFWFAIINTAQPLNTPYGWEIECNDIHANMAPGIDITYDSAGVGFCRNDDGSITTKSWGIYQGII